MTLRLLEVVDALVDHAIVGIDASGVIRTWSAGATRLFAVDEALAVGMSWWRIDDGHDPGTGLPPSLREAVRAGQHKARGWRQRGDGTRFRAEVVIRAIVDEGELRGFAAMVRSLGDHDASGPLSARRASSESLERIQGLMRVTDDPSIVVTTEGEVELWNGGAERLYGYAAQEMVGRSLERILPQDRRDEVMRIIERSAGGERIDRLETRRVSRTGREVDIELSVVPLLSDGGELTHLCLVHHDITERKRNETARRLLEDVIASIIDTAPLPITVHEGHRIIHANPQALAYLGYEAGALVGRVVDEIVSDTDRAAVRERVRAASEEGTLTPPRSCQLRRADGSLVWAECMGLPVRFQGRGAVAVFMRDLSERMRADEALRKSEERFRAIVEHSSDGFCLIDRDGKLSYLSPGVLRIVGASEPSTEDADFAARFDAESRAATRRAYERCRDTGDVTTCTARLRHRDGSWREVGHRFVNRLDCPGLQAILVTVQDVTERKRAEDALVESRHLLDQAEAVGRVGSWSVELVDGGRVVWSSGSYAIFGIPDGTPLTFATFLEHVHPDDRGLIATDFARVREVGSVDATFRVVRSDGSIRWVRATARVVDGTPPRLVGATHDLTEQRYAEGERDRFFHLSSDLLCIIDSETWQFRRANPSLLRRLGYSEAELTAIAFTSLLHPDDASAAADLRQLDADATVRQTSRLRCKDGSYRWLEWTAVPTPELGLIYASARDVTEERALEWQFLQAQKMEAVGRLAGGVAHDFNNILSMILGLGELIVEDLRPGDPMRDDMEEILTAGRRASALTRQLLAFSRRQVLQPRVLDLNVVLRDAERMLQRLIGEDVELTIVAGDPLGTVRADPGQLEQVLMNLAVNARDAMAQGGCLTIETQNAVIDEEFARSHLYPVKPGSYVLLTVADNGSGMDEATRARIFEPFFTTKEMGRGTGLGLSTVYGIVKQSGGYIWVESELERGTSFRIYLPRTDEALESGEREAQAAPRGGRETILLVEDEPQVRKVVRRALEKAGYKVLEAGNGGEALLLAEQSSEPIHLLITDVVMPRMSGPQVAARLRTMRPDLRVLFMSGYTEDAIRNHGVLAGASAFLEKPVAVDALLKRTREILDR